MAQPDNVAWAIWDDRCEKIANQQHSHMQANENRRDQALRLVEAIARAIGCDAGRWRRRSRMSRRVVRGEKKDEFGRDFGASPSCKRRTACRRSWVRSRTRRAGWR